MLVKCTRLVTQKGCYVQPFNRDSGYHFERLHAMQTQQNLAQSNAFSNFPFFSLKSHDIKVFCYWSSISFLQQLDDLQFPSSKSWLIHVTA
jgi:hypothetical protein